MASQIEAPVTGTEISLSNPLDSVKSVLMGVASLVLMFFLVGAAEKAYNRIAKETGDSIGSVEVL